MKHKDMVLSILDKNRGEAVSGEALATELGLTRSAVWKTVKALRKDGYMISSKSNSGYTLDSKCDLITEEKIRKGLKKQNVDIILLETVDSTNNYAKKLLTDGKTNSFLVVANAQTGGRGRHGKSFFSPKNGIYMSYVFFPDSDVADVVSVTSRAAVAVARAISNTSKINVGIKWVNDLYVENKKIAGILTEAVSDFEEMIAHSVVIGIGINFGDVGFPPELSDIATSIPLGLTTRSEVISEVVNELDIITHDLTDSSYINEYRARSVVINKEIKYTYRTETKYGRVTAINDDASLSVIGDDGVLLKLSSGEITLRVI
ncbi:MAG: biotin--[acetyl-CoA-carboxylase] ligase [Eubacteriales bacterium]|nr:biotin--[acetyl-CoA-carboxylase] ligase [Eubacteriales bacterium]